MPPDLPPPNPAAVWLAYRLLGAIFGAYIHTHFSGTQHLPPEGVPTVVAANHTSSLDVFAAGYGVRRTAHFLSKVEVTRIPVFGPFLLAAGAIPARRDGRDTAAVRQLVTALEAGRLVGVAPEGTRSPDGRLGAYDAGFVWLAARTGAVIVPCAIHGARALMPKGAQYPRRGDIWVRFGEPVDLAGEPRPVARERLEAIAADVRARTHRMLLDLEAESGVPNPALHEGGPGREVAAVRQGHRD